MTTTPAPSAHEASAARPTHLDLASGIGGFALAAQWAGYQTIGFCEIDPWPRKVLAKNFPGVPQHDDLKTLTGAVVREWISAAKRTEPLADAEGDAGRPSGAKQGQAGAGIAFDHRSQFGDELSLLTAGYPCQPFSLAGKRLGAEDDRHLWPFIAALVADLKPRRCLFENVYGHVSMGLDAVLADLEALGYACGAVVVPAAAVGAPHRRDRVWILADAGRGDDAGRAHDAGGHERHGHDSGWPQGASWFDERGQVLADSEGLHGSRQPVGTASEHAIASRTGAASDAADAAARGIRRGRSSGHERLAPFRDQGEPDGQTLSGLGDQTPRLPGRMARSGWNPGPDVIDPWAGDWEAGCPRTQEHELDRVHKLKALGNAIVPQVAYAILDSWGLPDMPESRTPLTPAAPARTVRKLFAPTRSYPVGPLLLAESRRQYPEALAVYANSATIATHGLSDVVADDRVPKGVLEVEVEEGTR